MNSLQNWAFIAPRKCFLNTVLRFGNCNRRRGTLALAMAKADLPLDLGGLALALEVVPHFLVMMKKCTSVDNTVQCISPEPKNKYYTKTIIATFLAMMKKCTSVDNTVQCVSPEPKNKCYTKTIIATQHNASHSKIDDHQPQNAPQCTTQILHVHTTIITTPHSFKTTSLKLSTRIIHDKTDKTAETPCTKKSTN